MRLADVLAYREWARRQRAATLDHMVADAEDAGLYDLPDDVSFERLSVEIDKPASKSSTPCLPDDREGSHDGDRLWG